MSATTGLTNSVVPYNSAEGVQNQIQSTTEQIRGLSQDLQALSNQLQSLIAQLQALEPPVNPGSKASDSAKQAYQNALTDYNRKVAELQSKINDVNERSRDISERISDLQSKVETLKNSDLPAAQRVDNQLNEEALKRESEKYENTGKQAEKAASSGDEAVKTDAKARQMRVDANTDTSSTSDRRLTLRVTNQTVEKLDKDTDLKTVVKYFQVALVSVGDGTDTARRSNPATSMPYTPALGLPPVETP